MGWWSDTDDRHEPPPRERPTCEEIGPEPDQRTRDTAAGREARAPLEQSATPRPELPRRGPAALVIVHDNEGWPMSNLHRDGCKHDIYVGEEQRLADGHVVPCAKCGAALIYDLAARAALAAFEQKWGPVSGSATYGA